MPRSLPRWMAYVGGLVLVVIVAAGCFFLPSLWPALLAGQIPFLKPAAPSTVLTIHAEVRNVLRFDDKVNSVMFSPDGKLAVTASQDKTAQIWDASTGKLAGPALQHTGEVNWAEFSPDGKKVLTASKDHTARVWDATTGAPASPPIQADGEVSRAHFSPDGTRILTTSATARVWDAVTGAPVTPAFGSGAEACFSGDGARVLDTTGDRRVQVWDAVTGKPVGPAFGYDPKENRFLNTVRFSPDGKRVLTASGGGGGAGGTYGTADIWDPQTGSVVLSLPRQNTYVMSAEYSPDGQSIVTGCWDNTAQVWSASGRALTDPIQHEDWVNYAAFGPDGKTIFTITNGDPRKPSGPALQFWDVRDGRWLTLVTRDVTTISGEVGTGTPPGTGTWFIANGAELVTREPKTCNFTIWNFRVEEKPAK